jgi:hypothetical protein
VDTPGSEVRDPGPGNSGNLTHAQDGRRDGSRQRALGEVRLGAAGEQPIPSEFRVRDDLPKNTSGEIMKQLLLEEQ